MVSVELYLFKNNATFLHFLGPGKLTQFYIFSESYSLSNLLYIHLIFCFAVCSLHPLAFLYPIFCLSACIYFCIQSFVYLPVSSSILQLCAIFFPGLTLPPCPLHCNCLSSFFFFSFSSVAFFSSIFTDLILTFSPILFCPLHYNRLSPIFLFFFTHFLSDPSLIIGNACQ